MSKELTILAEKSFSELATRCIPLGNTPISSRVFFDWRSKGIIDYPHVEGTKRAWVTLNFFDYLWINICASLVEFKVSSKLIKSIKNLLYEDLAALIENGSVKKNSLKKAMKKQLDSMGIEKTNEEIEVALDEFIEEKSIGSNDGNLFRTTLGEMLASIFYKNESPIIMIHKNPDMQAPTLDIINPVMDKDSINFLSDMIGDKPVISIPLRPFVEQFVTEEKNMEHLIKFKLISDWEKNVIELIRSNDFKEIVISKNEKEKMIVKRTTKGELIGENVKELKKLFGLKNYKKVTITHRNDKHVYFENTMIEDI